MAQNVLLSCGFQIVASVKLYRTRPGYLSTHASVGMTSLNLSRGSGGVIRIIQSLSILNSSELEKPSLVKLALLHYVTRYVGNHVVQISPQHHLNRFCSDHEPQNPILKLSIAKSSAIKIQSFLNPFCLKLDINNLSKYSKKDLDHSDTEDKYSWQFHACSDFIVVVFLGIFIIFNAFLCTSLNVPRASQ